ncbi:MAG: Gfo/Idh/MocA family oxidoreductase [Cytophagales bacterium]|nr:Gfo/Idh/MocA family oxidoreductase [Cytophagales bacterium]
MLNIGLVGVGHLGKIHIQQLKELPQWNIAGFFDTSAEVSAQVKEDYDIKHYSNIEALLENCDVVDIVCPTIFHYEYAYKSIIAGKHVFIEKPVTETVAQATELKKMAQIHKVNIQVGHVERYNPAYVSAAAHQLKPMFIEAHRLSEFNPRGTDVSVVLDLMIHDIDIVLHMVHSPVKHLSASGVSIVSNNPDIANARVEFENGCVANLTASRISLQKMRKMRIFQKNAYILIDFLNKITEIFSLEPYTDHPLPFTFVLDTGTEKKMVKMEKPTIVAENAIKNELSAFHKSITGGHVPDVSIEDGLKALELAYMIIDQIRVREENFNLLPK